jgi:pimeloyl-ACP methyl ester carboxylesterase
MTSKKQKNTITKLQSETSSKQQSRFRKLTKRFFIGLFVFVAAILLTGAAYQFVAAKLDERAYQAPGKMVDVGGYSLHLYCTGEGERTVVLDAGLGGGMLDWSLVQPEISKFTRVCSFDHAGAGWSDAGPEPRDSRQMVNELHALLQNAGLKAPFVFVGHSLGGANLQLYASRFPEQVAGLVLVDSSHENQFSRIPLPALSSAVPLLIKALAPIGAGRIILGIEPLSENVTPAFAKQRASVYSHTGHLFSVADEFANAPKSLEYLRANTMRLGEKPLIVLTRGKAQDTEAVENIWRELQSDLASRSSRGKHIMAEKSGHYIQFDEPELVVGAIREVFDAAKSR